MPKANVDHTISGQGTVISTLDHSATTPKANYIYKVVFINVDVENGLLEKTDGEKLSFILSSVKLVSETTKACQQILHNRANILHRIKVNFYVIEHLNLLNILKQKCDIVLNFKF